MGRRRNDHDVYDILQFSIVALIRENPAAYANKKITSEPGWWAELFASLFRRCLELWMAPCGSAGACTYLLHDRPFSELVTASTNQLDVESRKPPRLDESLEERLGTGSSAKEAAKPHQGQLYEMVRPKSRARRNHVPVSALDPGKSNSPLYQGTRNTDNRPWKAFLHSLHCINCNVRDQATIESPSRDEQARRQE